MPPCSPFVRRKAPRVWNGKLAGDIQKRTISAEGLATWRAAYVVMAMMVSVHGLTAVTIIYISYRYINLSSAGSVVVDALGSVMAELR